MDTADVRGHTMSAADEIREALAAENWQQAVAIAEGASRTGEVPKDVLERLAKGCFDAGLYAQALPWAEQLTKVASGNAGYWHALGMTRRKVGDFEGARKAQMRTLAIAPGHTRARTELAKIARDSASVPISPTAKDSEFVPISIEPEDSEFAQVHLEAEPVRTTDDGATQALAYVKQARATGSADDDIRAALRQVGWSDVQALSLLAACPLVPHVPAHGGLVQHHRRPWVVAGVAAGVLLLLVLSIALFVVARKARRLQEAKAHVAAAKNVPASPLSTSQTPVQRRPSPSAPPVPQPPPAPPPQPAPPYQPEPDVAQQPMRQEGALRLVYWRVIRGDYSYYVVGDVVNETGRLVNYAQIDFTVFDRYGAQIGSAWGNANNIAPGVTWRFKALIFEDNFADVRLANLSGY